MNVKNKLKNIAIEISTRCAASCIMCPRDSFTRKKAIMDFPLFKKSVDESAALDVEVMSLCGFGETLLDTGFEEKLKYIKDKYPGIKLGITTTGHLMEGHILEAVCNYLDVIRISHYGMTKATYETVHRGALTYEKIKDNIENLLKNTKRPKVILSFIVLPENQHEMRSWIDYWEKRVERVDVWKTQNWAGGYDTGVRYAGKAHPCRAIVNLEAISILVNGDVSLCCNDYNGELILGSILKNSLKEIIFPEYTPETTGGGTER